MNYGRYETARELGRGAMGVVYQAHDPQIDRTVALKVLRQDRYASETFVRRFLKEAKAIGRLSHPNIVTVYDAGEDRGTIYIAMEFLDGRPLNEVIQEKSFTFDEIVNIGIEIADTLDYAHGKGVIHRDIKPSNIVVQPNGHVKITDFGIARIEDPSATLQTQDGEILGTPAYMSPEQVMGHTVDGRSDIFSLGVILYELSTGKRPFGREGHTLATLFNEIVHSDPPQPLELNADIDPRLSRIIMKCLSKDPEGRFATGGELAETLRNRQKMEEAVPSPALPVEKQKPRSNVPLLLLFLLLLVGGAVYFAFPGMFQNIFSKGGDLGPKEPPPKGLALLNIQSSPSKAEVWINGVLKGKTPLDVELPLGKHSVKASLPGHEDWSEELALNEARLYPLQMELRTKMALAYVKVDSKPPGAQVYVDGAPKGIAPLGLELPLGEHALRLALPGHDDWVSLIHATEVKEYPIEAALKPAAGAKMASLNVDTNPAGASIVVDGELVGRSPSQLSLPVGKHLVRMRLEGYLDWVDVVQLNEGKNNPLTAEFKPALSMATLKLDSKPPGADVQVDGRQEGKTPLTVGLPVGQKTVRVTMRGFQEWVNNIHLQEPKEYPLTVQLQPLQNEAVLQIQSNPPGAQVLLNGNPMGLTPVKLNAPAGKHSIRISLANHQDWESRLQVEEGKEYPLSVDLKALSKDALLSVASDPPNASVYVDGEVKGKTPMRLKLPAGKHTVRMTLNQFRDWESEVHLVEAQEHPINAKLAPAPPKRVTPKPPVTTTTRPGAGTGTQPTPPAATDGWGVGEWRSRQLNKGP